MMFLTVTGFGLGWVLKPELPLQSASTQAAPVEPVGSLVPADRTNPANPVAQQKSVSALPIDRYVTRGVVTSDNMGRAMDEMMKENDPLKKAAMFTALLEQLTPDNAKAAFEALRASSGGGGRGGFGRGGEEMRLFLNAWGRIDGETAVAELTALDEQRRAEQDDGGGGRGRRGDRDGGAAFDIFNALTGWATTDADAAMAYVNTLEEDDRRRGMYTSGIVRGLMVNGVDAAVDFIAALPEGEEGNARGRYMSTVAEVVLEQGVSSAAKWVDDLQSEDLKQGALDRIAGAYAREDLGAAVSWISKYADEEFAGRAVTEVAERWAESDPEAVMQWASDLPESTQTRVFEEALNEWTERDPVAASEYLAQMPASTAKDSAVEGFARELAREDPESAALWAGTIGNSDVRTSTLTDVARNWLRTDRQAAEAWLPNSGLPAEVQQQVVEGGGRDGWRGRGGRRGF